VPSSLDELNTNDIRARRRPSPSLSTAGRRPEACAKALEYRASASRTASISAPGRRDARRLCTGRFRRRSRNRRRRTPPGRAGRRPAGRRRLGPARRGIPTDGLINPHCPHSQRPRGSSGSRRKLELAAPPRHRVKPACELDCGEFHKLAAIAGYSTRISPTDAFSPTAAPFRQDATLGLVLPRPCE